MSASQAGNQPADLIPTPLISQIIALASRGRVYAEGSSLGRAQGRSPPGEAFAWLRGTPRGPVQSERPSAGLVLRPTTRLEHDADCGLKSMVCVITHHGRCFYARTRISLRWDGSHDITAWANNCCSSGLERRLSSALTWLEHLKLDADLSSGCST